MASGRSHWPLLAGQSLGFEGMAMGDLVSGDAEKPWSCCGGVTKGVWQLFKEE